MIYNKKKIYTRFYTMLVALLPFFSMYSALIPGLSITDILLIIALFFTVLGFDKDEQSVCLSRDVNFLFYGLLFIILLMFISMIIQKEFFFENIIRVTRYGFYVLCFFQLYRMVDIALLKNIVVVMSFFSSYYIFLQMALFKFFGYVLKGFVSFWPLSTEGYALTDYEKIYTVMMYRPTSIFFEPAHFSRYVLIAICILLFDGVVNVKKLILTAILCLGILMSTSTQGYCGVSLLFVFFLLFYRRRIQSVFLRNMTIILVFFLPLLIMGLLEFEFVANTVHRTLDADISDSNSAWGRLHGFRYFFQLPNYFMLIGKGFGSVPPVWVSSMGFWLYGCGLIITCAYLFFLVKQFIRLSGYAKWLMGVFIFLFITDDCFYNSLSILFYTLIFSKPISKINEYGQQNIICGK